MLREQIERHSMLKLIRNLFCLLLTISAVSAFSNQAEVIGTLPEAISNNAVAAAKTSTGWQLYSFNGLRKSKDWQGVTNLAMRFDLTTRRGYSIDKIPYKAGRLASIAVTVKNKIYLFGGYTVNDKHEEKSMPDVYQFDPETQKFTYFTDMSIPVDDTVALVYQERYIYLISGWHDVGNIADVQVLDTETKKWFFATPYPGDAAFGHAGGLVGNQMVIVDGVKVSAVKNNRRQFSMTNSAYIGEINADDFTQINWRQLPPHPGHPGYRMAATGIPASNQVMFVGGSDNPYNYNGIGYNGEPSQPSRQRFVFDLITQQWQLLTPHAQATMDHRGLLLVDGKTYLLGGMLGKQKVSNQVIKVAP